MSVAGRFFVRHGFRGTLPDCSAKADNADRQGSQKLRETLGETPVPVIGLRGQPPKRDRV